MSTTFVNGSRPPREAVEPARTVDLGPLERIPEGEGRTFEVAGPRGERLEVAVFRTRQGTVHAVQARCPHRQGPLADGIVGASVVVCPLHAYLFDLRTGQSLSGGCENLRTFRVRVDRCGHVQLEL